MAPVDPSAESGYFIKQLDELEECLRDSLLRLRDLKTCLSHAIQIEGQGIPGRDPGPHAQPAFAGIRLRKRNHRDLEGGRAPADI
jgi:hypothetical protein